ncbi:MAG: PIN domain-containing protein [Anaerolineales bacterium]
MALSASASRRVRESDSAAGKSGSSHWRCSLCRDPDDDIVLETAVVGKATHVVSRDEDITRDTDLFAQLKQLGIEPITVARFLRKLEAG